MGDQRAPPPIIETISDAAIEDAKGDPTIGTTDASGASETSAGRIRLASEARGERIKHDQACGSARRRTAAVVDDPARRQAAGGLRREMEGMILEMESAARAVKRKMTTARLRRQMVSDIFGMVVCGDIDSLAALLDRLAVFGGFVAKEVL